MKQFYNKNSRGMNLLIAKVIPILYSTLIFFAACNCDNTDKAKTIVERHPNNPNNAQHSSDSKIGKTSPGRINVHDLGIHRNSLNRSINARNDGMENGDDATEFFKAIVNNDIESVKKNLSNGMDVNGKGSNDITPLQRAILCSNCDPRIVELLIAYGADIEVSLSNYDTNETPLFLALRYVKTEEAAKILINRGAKLDVKYKESKTPLHYALRYGKYEAAILLIEKGADVNAEDKDGRTPFSCNSRCNKPELVKLLIEKGADIKVKDNNGYTPLYHAIEKNSLEMVKLFLDHGFNVNEIYCWNNETPLLVAAQNQHIEIAKFLIDRGSNMDDKDSNGNNSLLYVVKDDRIEFATLLLDKKADVNAKDSNGDTPLCHAIKKGNLAMVQLLLKHGANVEKRNCIMATYTDDHVKILSLLLEARAKLSSVISD